MGLGARLSLVFDMCLSLSAAILHDACRLDVEYVDLYLMHSPIGGKILETWDAMIELKEQGLIK